MVAVYDRVYCGCLFVCVVPLGSTLVVWCSMFLFYLIYENFPSYDRRGLCFYVYRTKATCFDSG